MSYVSLKNVLSGTYLAYCGGCIRPVDVHESNNTGLHAIWQINSTTAAPSTAPPSTTAAPSTPERISQCWSLASAPGESGQQAAALMADTSDRRPHRGLRDVARKFAMPRAASTWAARVRAR